MHSVKSRGPSQGSLPWRNMDSTFISMETYHKDVWLLGHTSILMGRLMVGLSHSLDMLETWEMLRPMIKVMESTIS